MKTAHYSEKSKLIIMHSVKAHTKCYKIVIYNRHNQNKNKTKGRKQKERKSKQQIILVQVQYSHGGPQLLDGSQLADSE
jgi:hypothetical protein